MFFSRRKEYLIFLEERKICLFERKEHIFPLFEKRDICISFLTEINIHFLFLEERNIFFMEERNICSSFFVGKKHFFSFLDERNVSFLSWKKRISVFFCGRRIICFLFWRKGTYFTYLREKEKKHSMFSFLVREEHLSTFWEEINICFSLFLDERTFVTFFGKNKQLLLFLVERNNRFPFLDERNVKRVSCPQFRSIWECPESPVYGYPWFCTVWKCPWYPVVMCTEFCPGVCKRVI